MCRGMFSLATPVSSHTWRRIAWVTGETGSFCFGIVVVCSVFWSRHSAVKTSIYCQNNNKNDRICRLLADMAHWHWAVGIGGGGTFLNIVSVCFLDCRLRRPESNALQLKYIIQSWEGCCHSHSNFHVHKFGLLIRYICTPSSNRMQKLPLL